MTEKEKLSEQSEKYKRLKSLTEQSGWQDLEEMLLNFYSQAFDTVKNPEDVDEANKNRAIMTFIEEFITTINNEINFSKMAKEKYIKKYFNKNIVKE